MTTHAFAQPTRRWTGRRIRIDDGGTVANSHHPFPKPRSLDPVASRVTTYLKCRRQVSPFRKRAPYRRGAAVVAAGQSVYPSELLACTPAESWILEAGCRQIGLSQRTDVNFEYGVTLVLPRDEVTVDESGGHLRVEAPDSVEVVS